MSERYSYFKDFEIAGCAAIEKNRVGFWAQQWPTNDTLEQRPTSAFFFYADEPPEEQWATRGIAQATGIHGCVTTVPKRQWIYVLDDGEVYVVGGGAAKFEDPIVSGRPAYFTNVRTIRTGEVLAVGGRRKVYLREGESQWRPFGQLQHPEGPDDNLTDAGFRDIHGFNLDELYAVGGRGDAWVCLAGQWQPIDLGTNVGLKRVLCAADGRVYIVTDRHDLYVGRHQAWQRVSHDLSDEIHESIVDFNGRVLLSTAHQILEVVQGQIVAAALPGMPTMQSMAHLATGDGVLVVAGKDEAVLFDGSSWLRILDPQP